MSGSLYIKKIHYQLQKVFKLYISPIFFFLIFQKNNDNV